jgi:hypothetical protein
MERVILWIVARHDPSNDFAAGTGEKKRGITVLIKRMFFAIKKFLPLEQERRHPHRIVRIDPPGKFYEGITFRGRTDPGDFDSRHEELISPGAPPCARANWDCGGKETA